MDETQVKVYPPPADPPIGQKVPVEVGGVGVPGGGVGVTVPLPLQLQPHTMLELGGDS